MKAQKMIIAVFLSLILVISMTGCGNGETEEGTAAFDGTIYFAGSSTLAPTISQIADSFQQEFGTWDQVNASLPAKEIQISVSTGGSGAGAKAVLDGTASFGMLARDARDEERDALDAYQEIKVGIDALLMAVNKENALGASRSDLSAQEVRQIFSGEISHWNEMDDSLPGEEIILLVRDVGGGAHSVFQDTIMGDIDVSDAAIEVPSMSGLVDRLMDNSQAIGYASYGVAEQHQDDLVAFSLDGIEPTENNIMDGIYPVSRPLILVWNGELSVAEEEFLNYIKSDIGYQIIGEMGFLPVR